MGIQKDQVGIK